MNILFTEPYRHSPKALRTYSSMGRIFELDKVKKNSIRAKKIFKDTQILVIRNFIVDKKFIDSLPNLKMVVSPTTGVNHIDTNYLKKKGIKVISLKGRTGFLKNITSTADHTMALVLALLHHLPWSFDEVKKGNWPRNEFIGNQLKGKTLGILGYGRLGKIVARYAKAFWMKVVACDPYVSLKTMKKHGVEKVSMSGLFKESDVVSIHASLTEETQSFVGEKFLKLMKKDAVLINTARGEIIKGDALFRALKKGWIKGAAIDVLRDERRDGSHLRNNKLWHYARSHKNLIICPHIGGTTVEAMEATEIFVAELAKKYFLKKDAKK